MRLPYDVAVWDLAGRMLDMAMVAVPSETHRKNLAAAIQKSIDDYLDTLQPGGPPHE